MSPIHQAAEAAFQKALPILLISGKGKWVAYHGSSLVAIAATKPLVYQGFNHKKHPLTEIMVRRIEPNGPPVDLRRPRRVAARHR